MSTNLVRSGCHQSSFGARPLVASLALVCLLVCSACTSSSAEASRDALCAEFATAFDTWSDSSAATPSSESAAKDADDALTASWTAVLQGADREMSVLVADAVRASAQLRASRETGAASQAEIAQVISSNEATEALCQS
jgi:hypothetical protein